MLEVEERVPDTQPEKSATFDEVVTNFADQLAPQSEQWADPQDQLAELFTQYLTDHQVPAFQITEWQSLLYQRLKDPQFAHPLLAQIVPRDDKGERTAFDPRYHWQKKINRDIERIIQPAPQLAEKSILRSRPPTTLERPLHD